MVIGAEADLAAKIAAAEEPLEAARACVPAGAPKMPVLAPIILIGGSLFAVAYLFYQVAGSGLTGVC